MECGKYEAINDIHVFSCNLGQLKIPKGKTIEVEDDGFRGYADEIEFPARLLNYCKGQLRKV